MDIPYLLSDDRLARVIMEALPCGLMIIDRNGRVMALNNIFERVFGVREIDAIQKRFGDVLGCLNALRDALTCGSSGRCRTCEIRKIATTTLMRRQGVLIRLTTFL